MIDGRPSDAAATVRSISVVALLRLAQYPFILASAALLPRIMGPHTYGEYALLLSFVAIAFASIDLGVGEVFARFVPELQAAGGTDRLRTFASRFLALKLVTASAACLLLFALLERFYGERLPHASLWLVAGAVLAIDLGSVPYSLAFGLNQLERCALRDPLKRALTLGLTLLGFHYFGLLGAVATTLVVEAGLAALYFSWTRSYFVAGSLRPEIEFVRPYLAFGLAFYASFALSSTWQKLGNLLIDWITASTREVALFDIGNQVYLLTVSFFNSVIYAFVPVFTRLLLAGRESTLLAWSRLVLDYVAIPATVAFWAFFAFGEDLIALVIGEEYREVFAVGAILLLATIPMAFAQLGVAFAMVYRRPAAYLGSLVLAFASFVAAALLLVPARASLGCALAVLVSHGVLLAMMCAFFRRTLLPCVGSAARSLAAGAVFVPLLWLGDGFPARAAAFALALGVYAGVLIGLGVLRRGHARMLYDAWTGRAMGG